MGRFFIPKEQKRTEDPQILEDVGSQPSSINTGGPDSGPRVL